MKIKKIIMLLIVVLGITVTSCEKEEDDYTPEPAPTYELRFTSTSDNPYTLDLLGNSYTIEGRTYKTFNLEKGTYSWKVTQQSGYLVYPTEESGTVNLNQDLEIVFPE